MDFAKVSSWTVRTCWSCILPLMELPTLGVILLLSAPALNVFRSSGDIPCPKADPTSKTTPMILRTKRFGKLVFLMVGYLLAIIYLLLFPFVNVTSFRDLNHVSATAGLSSINSFKAIRYKGVLL